MNRNKSSRPRRTRMGTRSTRKSSRTRMKGKATGSAS